MTLTAKSFSYTAYGLEINSSLALPELVAGREAPADVVVRMGAVEPLPREGTRPAASFRPRPQEARLYWEEAGRFLVRDGREITVEPAPGVEEEVLRLYVLGPAMAMLLHQRGLLVLHASAVEMGGGGVAFLGGPGWGKSTTAAALHARGHALVADDVIALDPDGAGPPTLASGFPQLKLAPDVARSVGEAPEGLARLHPRHQKRGHRNIRPFRTEPLPLRRLYVLEEGPAIELEPVSPQEAVVELVRHSYLVRLLAAEETEVHFVQCANLVKAVSVRRLRRPRHLEGLAALARSVEDDVLRPD